jgi:hypothetical protein
MVELLIVNLTWECVCQLDFLYVAIILHQSSAYTSWMEGAGHCHK